MDEGDLLDKGKDFLKVFQTGQEVIQRLLTETEQLRSQKALMLDKLDAAQSEIRLLAEHNHGLNSEKQAIEQRVHDLESKIADLEKNQTDAEERYKSEQAALESTLESTRQDLVGVQQELQSRNAEIGSRQSELTAVRGELEAALAELDTRNATINERDRALAKAERRIAESSSQQAALSSQLDEQQRKTDALEQRVAAAEGQANQATVEIENLRLESERAVAALTESERKNDGLANLYLAAFALHRSLELADVTQALGEILTNQIGLASYIVAMSNENGLEVISARGNVPERLTLDGTIGEAFIAGSPIFGEQSETRAGEPFAAIPLITGDSSVGVIGLYQMLPQKTGLTAGDQELLALLSRLAATALIGARLNLHSRNGRSVLRSFLTRFRSQNREQAS
jgi:predicted  nucleic acid-binding Zn-ribbon protein